MTTKRIALTVNGTARALDALPLRRLLDVLRDDLGLYGTKEGCGEGECGACTVLIDGAAVNSCLIPVCQVAGREITTIEAAGLERIQEAFVAEGGAQCGICTPGMVVAGVACVRSGRELDEETIREALAGNLCRCTGYVRIVQAVAEAVEEVESR